MKIVFYNPHTQTMDSAVITDYEAALKQAEGFAQVKLDDKADLHAMNVRCKKYWTNVYNELLKIKQ